VRYPLCHGYDEPSYVGSEYAGGDFREVAGGHRLQPSPASTYVVFWLRIDPGFHVPGAIAKMLGRGVMGMSLSDVKTRFEAVGHGSQ
jgi:hypothetical protein